MNASLHNYAVDQFTPQAITTRNGHYLQIPERWETVLEIQAPRAARALRAADGKWPGKLHRARLIQTATGPAMRQLSADDRALIHQLTHQAI